MLESVQLDIIRINTFIDCGTDYQIEFGTINYQERWTTYKSRATVTCDKGYTLEGEEYVTCLSSGTWSTLTRCVAHGIVLFNFFDPAG